MTSVSPKVCPTIPRDAETYRLQIIGNIHNDLTIFMNQDRALAKRQEKKLVRCLQAASLLGMGGTAVSIAGGTIGATGIGVIPGGVLIGNGGILGAASVVALKMKRCSSK